MISIWEKWHFVRLHFLTIEPVSYTHLWNAGLTGFEFAAGIPGSVGGAVAMNAGAYGGEVKDVLLDAEVVTQEGELLT